LISAHCSAHVIRDRIAHVGPGAQVWAADIPACFRRQLNNPRLLPLFVYTTTTEEFGLEWWLDPRNPFGWIASEWGWQCILHVIMWRARSMSIEELMAFVDNFFDIALASVAAARRKVIEKMFADLGIDLHEVMVGSHFKGLGWLWDLDKMSMECPMDKYVVTSAYLREWLAATKMSLKQVETAVGLLSWASTGLPMLTQCVAPLIHMRTALERIHEATGADKRSVTMSKPPHAAVAIEFAASVYLKWNRTCPILGAFGPTATWHILGRCDASTDWGCGGFIFDGVCLRAFQHQWTAAERELAMCDIRESTTVEELQGAAHWARIFEHLITHKRVQLEMDSASSVGAIEKAFSAKPAVLTCLTDLRASCARAGIHLRVRHVLGTVFNKIADALSRDNWLQACLEAQNEFGLPLLRM
jgi:hypothetical protein